MFRIVPARTALATALTAALTAALFAATPALAQSAGDVVLPDPTLPDPNDRSDNFTIAVGGAWIPDYE